MIRTAVVWASLAVWPTVAPAQDALGRVVLIFSPASTSVDAPLVAAVGAASGPPGAAADREGTLAERIEAVREAEAALSDEESRSGASSLALLEPLASLAGQYRDVGDYALAVAALERARQIVRSHEGLSSLRQVELMNATIDTLEAAGAYYESDTLQDELLVLARRNDGDARVPGILVDVADRQMEAVERYLAADGWERSLERIRDTEGSGWDLENIEFMRRFAGQKPLKQHEDAIRELLESGRYEIGDELDARQELLDAYALIDVVNDHNEAGQRRVSERGLVFEPQEVQRDLALSAFRRARRLYSSALQLLLAADAHDSAEFFATEAKLLDTYRFELGHIELYPDRGVRGGGRGVRARGPQALLRRPAYGTGTGVLEARVVNLLSRGSPAVEIAAALMELADWHLQFSSNRRALELYQDAHDLLVREDVSAAALADAVTPELPVSLAAMASDESSPFDAAAVYAGYVDVAFETGRFGEVKKADIVGSSSGTPSRVVQRARTHAFETRFRPRFEAGRPERSDAFELRYYYRYGSGEAQ